MSSQFIYLSYAKDGFGKKKGLTTIPEESSIRGKDTKPIHEKYTRQLKRLRFAMDFIDLRQYLLKTNIIPPPAFFAQAVI